MIFLVIGCLLFAGVHLIPSLAPGVRAGWYERMGEGGYKGSFSVLLLLAIALMVTGWRSAEPAFVYLPSPALHQTALCILVLAFLLLVVSARKSRVGLLVRHPQLTGVTLWGVAHLLLNGDSRSLVLFGGMALWAVVEMIAINRREGVWIKYEAPTWSAEIVTLLITAVTIGLTVYLHPWLAGLPAL